MAHELKHIYDIPLFLLLDYEEAIKTNDTDMIQGILAVISHMKANRNKRRQSNSELFS